MPEGYLSRPELIEGLEFFWEAFQSLSSDRQVGIGEGEIPFTAIDRFCERYGIDGLDEFEEFRSFIRAIDGEYLKIRAEQSKRDQELSKKDQPV